MPIYEYVHEKANADCLEPVEVFQRMADDHLAQCPHCGRAVYRTVSVVRMQVKDAPFDEAALFRNRYSHKTGRKVEKHEQFYTVPKQPGGGGGQDINLTGMTPRQKEEAITEAHAKAGDTRITELGEKVELVE